MQTPLQLTFRNMVHSDSLANHLEQHVEQLDQMFDRIISCHIVAELFAHDQHHGSRYRFSININVPGHEILVTHTPSADRALDDAYATADHAFDEAKRQLKDWVGRQREQRHERPAQQ